MKKIDRTGEIHINKQGYQIKIIKYIDNRNSTILFSDGNIVYNKAYKQIQLGKVLNPFHPTVCGVGYLGDEKRRENNKNNKQAYSIWLGIIKRCYSSRSHKKHPTYLGCSVVDEWHNFQNFSTWYEQNYIEGWHVDKDILVKGNKTYGPETCCFVPREINNLFMSNKKGNTYSKGINKKHNKFIVRCPTLNGRKTVGSFYNLEEAIICYNTKRKEYLKHLTLKHKDKLKENVLNVLFSIFNS